MKGERRPPWPGSTAVFSAHAIGALSFSISGTPSAVGITSEEGDNTLAAGSNALGGTPTDGFLFDELIGKVAI